jgi:hypothetical protein
LHRFVEALILLAANSGPRTLSGGCWLSELSYVMSLVDLEKLDPPFQKTCRRFLGSDWIFNGLLDQGRRDLGHRLRRDTHSKDVESIRMAW